MFFADVVDDVNVVSWRRSNKVGVKLAAKVQDDVSVGEKVVVTFGLKFLYTNTISALEQRSMQTVDVVIPVNVVLGNASG